MRLLLALLFGPFFFGPFFFRAARGAQNKAAFGNRFAQRFDVRFGIFGGRAGEDEREFFAAVAKSDATRDGGDHGSDHLEHLIAAFVAMSVVELLEVINVTHSDGVATAE